MSSETIRFATFNCGSGWTDYLAMANATPEQREALKTEMGELKSDADVNAARDRIMPRIETLVAENLAKDLDVICLQELKEADRPLLKTLEEKGFYIVRLEENDPSKKGSALENVIAIRKGKFKSIDNVSVASESHPVDGRTSYGQQIAAALVRLKNSNTTLSFSSLYNWGFQIFQKGFPEDEKAKQMFDTDREGQDFGYAYTVEAVENVRKQQPTFAVIAGDLNNNPDNDARPFQYLEASRFKVKPTGEATNINGRDPNDYKFRELDFIFTTDTSHSWFSKIGQGLRSLFVSTVKIETTDPKVLEGYDFTINTNCSDHKPVGLTITVTETPSKIQSLWNWIRRK